MAVADNVNVEVLQIWLKITAKQLFFHHQLRPHKQSRQSVTDPYKN